MGGPPFGAQRQASHVRIPHLALLRDLLPDLLHLLPDELLGLHDLVGLLQHDRELHLGSIQLVAALHGLRVIARATGATQGEVIEATPGKLIAQLKRRMHRA